MGSPTPNEAALLSKLNALYADARKRADEVQTLKRSQEELTALLRRVSDAPKWIEEIPGKRSPYIAGVEITIAASSTSRAEGTLNIGTDGPFTVTGLAMFFQRTSAPYNGGWAPATTVEARMAAATQGVGFQYLYDQPVLGSFDIEVLESGADRNWQNIAFASALFSPAAGCVYVLPVSTLVGRASTLTVRVTPTIEQSVAGKVGFYFLGYKIVQGDTYQP